MDTLRSQRLVTAAVAFVAGLLWGGNPSGTAAEWASGFGSIAAVIAALALANSGAREVRAAQAVERQDDIRQRHLQWALDLLTFMQTDRLEAERSPGAEALVLALNAAGAALGEVVTTYYEGDTPETAALMQRLPGDQLWNAMRSDVLAVIQRIREEEAGRLPTAGGV